MTSLNSEDSNKLAASMDTGSALIVFYNENIEATLGNVEATGGKKDMQQIARLNPLQRAG